MDDFVALEIAASWRQISILWLRDKRFQLSSQPWSCFSWSCRTLICLEYLWKGLIKTTLFVYKNSFYEWKSATHDEMILLQVSIMVHLVPVFINQHGPSFLHSLLNKSLKRGNKLHGKFLALVFSDWQRQANLRNRWSSIKSVVWNGPVWDSHFKC